MTRPTIALAMMSAVGAMACSHDGAIVPGTDTGDESAGDHTTHDPGDDSTDDSTDDGVDASSSSGGEEVDDSPNWCDRVLAGPPGDTAVVELSLAHANIRLFGAEADYPAVDAALASALAPADALGSLDLSAYDDALDSVCIIPASAGELGAASVEMVGTIAWVRPGTGDVVLPTDAEVVVLDLRELPNVPELADVLSAAVAPALATEIPRTTRRVRRHVGHTDQAYSPDNAYYTDRADVTPSPIEPTGSADLELVVVTGDRLAPAAAELAGSLRLQERAWLVGHDVLAEVAESSWNPIGDVGAAWRSRDLLEWGTARWPGTVFADVLTNDPEGVVAARFPTGAPPEPAYDSGARSIIDQYDPWEVEYTEELGLGEIRTGLLVVHGVLELFFMYFDVVGHETDEALLDLLAETAPADADDRPLMEERLRRFSAALHDGHAYVYDFGTPYPNGAIAARFEAHGGYPVVRRANQPGLLPGDTIIEIEGEPTLDWYAARYPLVSAASDGWRHDLVTRMLTWRDDPIELTIESALGVVQTLEIDPATMATDTALGPAPVDRATGTLDDLGAPGLAYINLSNTTDEYLFAAIDDAILAPATGMIVDMRGYPTGDHYAVAERLIPGPFESPHFGTPVRTGPDGYEEQSDVYALAGADAYDGPMVLLVGHHSVSAAENFAIMLVGADRVTVVGQQSASTNGNISGIRLPGNFSLAFTSMRILFPDGSTFHGVGIVPDVEVPIDPAAYAQGDDPELLAAIATLQR